MDAHEKNAVMITAHAILSPGPRDLLHDLLFLYAGPGAAECTRQADTMVRLGRSLRSVWRYLDALAADDWIEIRRGGVRWWDNRPIQQPNSYRILTVAERHACQAGTLVFPEENNLSACTSTEAAREAARARWLPTLPPIEEKEACNEQEPGGLSRSAAEAGQRTGGVGEASALQEEAQTAFADNARGIREFGRRDSPACTLDGVLSGGILRAAEAPSYWRWQDTVRGAGGAEALTEYRAGVVVPTRSIPSGTSGWRASPRA